MMRRCLRALALTTVMAMGSLPLDAQAQSPPPGVQRQALERQFAERLGQVVKRELRLDDAQMRRLQQSNQRFERRRRALVFEERSVRIGMRDELEVPDSANQERVATLLEQMQRIQRDRLALVEDEQRELATFLTPVQRARYFGI
jgi:DNA repair photolyase